MRSCTANTSGREVADFEVNTKHPLMMKLSISLRCYVTARYIFVIIMMCGLLKNIVNMTN